MRRHIEVLVKKGRASQSRSALAVLELRACYQSFNRYLEATSIYLHLSRRHLETTVNAQIGATLVSAPRASGTLTSFDPVGVS